MNGQGMYTNFGQNRVQYGKFEWSFVRSENFDAYFYSGGRELGTFAARSAEEQLNDIEKVIDHRLSGRVEIICYNTLSDYKQANFGLAEAVANTGGYTQVVSNKIFVYFNGNHAHFLEQLRSGLSLVLINELLFGGSIQERLQNAALLNLADWQLFGLTSFIGKDWDIDKDTRMKDLIMAKKVKKFNRMAQSDPILAGHSFWRFLVDKYGPEVIANMVYVTRLSRSFESALIYVTGYDTKQTMKDWLKYYEEQYAREDVNRSLPNNDFAIKKRLRPYVEPQLKVGPKGDFVAFTTNKYGKYKVWLVDTKTGKTKKVHKGGLKYNQKEIDHSFPILSWHPGGEKFSYVFEKRGTVRITTVDIKQKKRETLTFLKFDKINSFDYSDNGRTLVVSAIRKGQSDIYTYDLQSRKERQITNDPADDLYPRFVDGSGKIIFSSNRDNELLGAAQSPMLKPDNNLDIYLYDLESGNKKMKRLSKTPGLNETHPMEYNRQYYSYLTEYNGIQNRYAVKVEEEYDYTEVQISYKDTTPTDTLNMENPEPRGESFVYNGKRITLNQNVAKIDTIIHNKDIVFTYPITNYSRSILAQDVCRQNQTVYDLIRKEGKYFIKYSPVVNDVEGESKKTETYPNMFRLKSGLASKPFVPGPEVFSKRPAKVVERTDVPKQEKKILADSNTYFFVNDFTPRTYKTEDIKPSFQQAEVKTTRNFKLAAPRFYDVTFFPDHFVAQLDNSVINSYYQPITAGGQNLFNPGLNGMINLGLIDLMEDYRITAGFRIPLDLDGTDYFLSYETLKKRLDHKVMFYRQIRNGSTPDNISVKNSSYEFRYIIKYPFSPVSSVRLNVFTRQDRDVFQSVHRQAIEMPDKVIYWTGFKAEYIFDNTIPRGLNLWNGTRFKVFYERYYNAQDENVRLNAVGFDARHYQRIHRQLIICSRLTYNTSFGKAKVKYVLGGVDNSLFPVYDQTNNTVSNEYYAFQALATNMRGFNQNIRNGSSYAVSNTEIRFPVFSYLFNRPIHSDFLNNFQVVPFFDIGTAWSGSDPYSDDNTFNQKIVQVKYLKATVINVREPIIAGFGNGVRSKLFGYFIRFDMSWGIQDLEVNKKPVYFISMSTDF